MIHDIFSINSIIFLLSLFLSIISYRQRRKNSEKRNRYNESFDPLLGGKTSYYVLGMVILLALIIYFFHQISFIFKPVGIIIATILPPLLFALILYYLLEPVIKRLSKHLSRNLSVIIVYVIILFLLGLGSVWLVPFLKNRQKH